MHEIAQSASRIGAIVLRHLYLLRASWPRMFDIIYWQVVQTTMWGVLQSYIATTSDNRIIGAGSLLGAVLLWDVLFRGQNAFTTTFLEEIWSKNIVNLLMTPLRLWEMFAGIAIISIVRMLIGLLGAAAVAWLLFDFNIVSIGPLLAVILFNLMLSGWAIGLVAAGLVLRNGLGAQGLASTMTYILLPLACVYYPSSALPDVMRGVALLLPPTHAFEAFRALLVGNVAGAGVHLVVATALNICATAVAGWIFMLQFVSAKRSGTLIHLGE